MITTDQVARLFLLALPVACIAWTVTHEEIFKEPRDLCVKRVHSSRNWVARKFFYVFTCEYCFSHYVALGMLIITRYHLVYDGWRGYLIGGFSLVWIANIYMSIFGLVRVGLKHEKMHADREEIKLQEKKEKID